ncbi:uncharacterized protein [Panulirus ornatus]|uniref:uncharacterized protein n=1 Tax=Panulirus ornatus TaxID=150431 RepID=UPI003A865748
MAGWRAAPVVVIVVVLEIHGVVVVEGRSRRQTTDACVCVPNTQCYSEDAGWWHCPNFGELCCDEAYIAGPCSCHNFFECSEGSVQWEPSTRCTGKDQVCCDRDESIPSRRPVSPPPDQTQPSLPPPPRHETPTSTTTTQPSPPAPDDTGEPCATIGTREGTCVPYSTCLTKLDEPVRLLTIEQFLHNYGCGANREGVARVCCPV